MTDEEVATFQIPLEYAWRLSEIAAERGKPESVLIEEALALLFCDTDEERDALRELIELHGESKIEKTGALPIEQIASVVPVPMQPVQAPDTGEC